MARDGAVIFEPHNDDFIIGMGGTGLQLLNAGWNIVSVVMTDGRFGSSELTPERTASIRIEEKEREVERLGVDWTNLKYRDQSLMSHSRTSEERGEIVTELVNLLERVDPALVFVPAPTEGHPDHRATHDLVTSALDREKFDVSVIEYVVWDVPFLAPVSTSPNEVLKVTIDSVFEEKLSTIRVHESQLREYPFDEMVTNFNSYLANLYHPEGGGDYVELLHIRERTASLSKVLDDIDAEDVTSKFHSLKQ